MKLVIQESDEYAYDITRIVEVCQQCGYKIDRATARKAWELYSESMAAGWMCLPQYDNDLLSIVLTHTTEIGE